VTVARSRIEEALEGARAHLRRVGPADVAALAAGDGVLVDIRPAAQRAKHGEIPGAVVVERNVLEWRLDPTSPQRLPAVDGSYLERPIVVVCQEGYASSFAAVSLQSLGLAGATDLDGGFEAWAAAGLPVVPPHPPGGEDADF
jgi:rhodanese-related sulfurtransferase